MTELIATAPEAPANAPAQPGATPRPDHLPEKFWDDQAGSVRVDALAKSYSELERRASGMVRVPGDGAPEAEVAAFRRALGVPDSPDAYQIAAPERLGVDPEVNQRLHAAGFSDAQAQLVYDLAAEKLMPMVGELAANFEAERQTERLAEHFGGQARWAEVSRQLSAWGRANLPAEVLGALSTTYDGVLALHGMMTSREPALGRVDGVTAVPTSEEEVRSLMNDPKYWRDRDPAVVRRVSDAFRRLYPGEA